MDMNILCLLFIGIPAPRRCVFGLFLPRAHKPSTAVAADASAAATGLNRCGDGGPLHARKRTLLDFRVWIFRGGEIKTTT